jgi:two-component system cell cycle sensor histidine kinase/response regulator CckA
VVPTDLLSPALAEGARALAAGAPAEALRVVLCAVRALLAAESAAVLQGAGEALGLLRREGAAPVAPGGCHRWPLVVAGEVVGALEVAGVPPERLAAAEATLAPLRDLAAVALREVGRAAAEASADTVLLDALHALLGASRAGGEPAALAELVVARARALAGADAAVLVLYEPATAAWHWAASTEPALLAAVGPPAAALVDQLAALAQGQVAAEGIALAAPLPLAFPPRALLTIPFEAGPGGHGLLVLARRGAQAFAAAETHRATLLAAQFGAALHAAGLRAETQALRLRAESFIELARESTATQELDRVLDQVAASACRLLGADFAAVYVLESDGQVARRSLYGARVPPPDRHRRTPPYGLVARVLERGATLVFEGLDRSPLREALPLYRREGGRTALGTPLRRNGTINGVLLLGWRRPVALGAEQVRLAEAVAAYGATALDSARTHAALAAQAEALRRLLAERTAVLEQLPSGLLVLDRHGRAELVNRAGLEILGTSFDPAQPVAEQIPQFQLRSAGDDRPLAAAESCPARIMAGETVSASEYVFRRPGTSQDVWIRASGVPMRDADGTVVGGVIVFSDVTRERRLVQQLAASEERFRIALMSIPITVFQMDTALRYTWVYHPQGLVSQPLLGRTDAELFPPAAAAQLTALKQSVLATGQGRRAEICVESADGERYYDLYLEPLCAADGQIVGLTGAAMDITARKREQAALQRLAAIVESSEDAIIGTAWDGTIVSWNRAAERYYGYTAAEACGRHITFIVPPEERELITARRARVLAGERLELLVAQRVRRDGQRIDVAVSVFPVTDSEGRIVGSASIARDITASKRAADALRRSEQFARAVLNALPAEIAALDREGQIIAVNDAWARHAPEGYGLVCGGVGQNYLGTCAALGARGPYAAEAIVGVRAVLAGERPDYSLEYRCEQGGTPRWFALYVTPLGEEAGGAVVAQLDITERKAVEEQLRQVQRLDAMGRLAGGVAHDFNNILTVINGFSELLLSQLPADDPRRACAEEILKAGERAAGVASQLLAFSRRQLVSPQVLDLNAVVRDTETMLRRLIGEDIVLLTRLDPTCGPVRADPGQLQQVLVNLAVNARDAMPRGGELFLQTQRVQLGAQAAAAAGLPGAGTYIALLVRDTGCGMDEATQARIFEPFFTTKASGRGTGLGLSTVYGIVKQSHGAISVRSQSGRGTTFTIYLPEVAERPAEAAPGGPAPPLAPGSETILLVEDEAQVRALARASLVAAGYTVLEARDGTEALALSARHPGPLHLLLTDVVMPGMSGSELARTLQARHPGLRVLYMSGYPDEALARHGVAAPHALLPKPFTPERLRAQVRRILDGRAVG